MNAYEYDSRPDPTEPPHVQPSWMSIASGIDTSPSNYGPVGPQGPYAAPQRPQSIPGVSSLSSGESFSDMSARPSVMDTLAGGGRPLGNFLSMSAGDAGVPGFRREDNGGQLKRSGDIIADNLASVPYVGPALERGFDFASPAAFAIPGSTSKAGLEALALASGGGPLARGAAKELGYGETGQNVADIAGSVAAPFAGPAIGRGVRAAGRAVNALDDAAAIRNAAGAGERSTYGVMGREALPDEPGVFAPASRPNIQGGADLTDAEQEAIRTRTGLQPSLERTNKLRAARGLEPLTEEPLAWTKPRGNEPPVPTPNALAELQRRVAKDGLTPDNRAIIDDALGVLFKTDVPEHLQPPPGVRPGGVGEEIGNAIIRRAEEAQAGTASPEIAQIEAIQNAGDDAFRESANAAPPRPPAPPEGPFSQPSFGGMEPPKPPSTTFGQRVRDVLSAPMTAKSTYDLSAPGRQLAPMLYAHPTAIPRVLKAQQRALMSADAFAASQEALAKAPNAIYRELAGVEMGGLTKGLAREEQIGSNLAQKVLPKSERFNDAYTAAINEGRDWLFNQMFSKIDPQLLTEGGLRNGGLEELKKIGRLVNASTGRGDLMGLLSKGSVADVAGQPLLWAPRLLAGRVQLPASMFSNNAIVRREAARQTAAFVGVNTAILGMIKASGAADVELDPRSSDFGQIRIGDRRFDPWAGYRPIANLIARAGVSAYNGVSGDTVANTKGINNVSGPGALTSRPGLEIITNFLRSKLAPIPGEVWNQVAGRDVTGQDVTKTNGILGGVRKGSELATGDVATPGMRRGLSRVDHAISGLLAPIFAESLGEELGYTVPRGFAQGGLPGAAAEVGKSAAANAFYGLGGGGGYYQPTSAEVARRGEYDTLSPPDQFEAIKPEAWRILMEKTPANLKPEIRGSSTFSSWFDATEKDYRDKAAERFPTRTRAELDRMALEAVRRNPIYKAYLNARTHLTDQWVKANPDLARELDDDMADVPASERTFVPTRGQRALIGATP